MTSIDEVERLADRYEEIQKELIGVLGSIKQIREVLGRSPQEIGEVREVLGSIGDSTEKAAHSLLEMIEEVMSSDDESSEYLNLLNTLDLGEAGKGAIEELTTRAEKRAELLNEMLVTMSFQDLTCQTLQKVSNRLGVLQEEVEALLSGKMPDDECLDRKHAGSMSGLKRLKNSQESPMTQQDLIDQLLGG